MRRSRWLWVAAYAVAVIVFVAGVLVLVRDRGGSEPEAAPMADVAAMPFATALSVRGSNQGRVGTLFPIDVEALTDQEVSQVELYDGATLVSRIAVPESGPAPGLGFPALSVGSHALHAAITSTDGEVALTSAVTVSVSPAVAPTDVVLAEDLPAEGDPAAPVEGPASEAPPVSVPLPSLPEETPQALADRFGLDVSQITVLDQLDDGDVVPLPDVDLAAAIPPGSVVVGSVAGDAGAEAISGGAVTVSNPAADRPGLTLRADATGCATTLTVGGTGRAVTVHRSAGGLAGWVTAAEREGTGEIELGALPVGTHLYMARAGTATSAVVSVTVPMSCSKELGWEGNVRIIDGTLHVPPVAFGLIYLYLVVDGGTAVRVPSDPDGAIAAELETDVSALIPTLDGRSLVVQAWSGGEFPQQLAGGRLQVADGQSLHEVIGEPSTVSLRAEIPEGLPTETDEGSRVGPQSPTEIQLVHEDRDISFTWTAASSRVEEVMWQVVTTAPGGGEIVPDDVLAAGISKTRADGTGTFTIDTAQLPGHEQVAERLEEIERLATDPTAQPTPTAAPPRVTLVNPPVTAASVPTLGEAAFSSPLTDAAEDGSLFPTPLSLPGPAGSVWVRVVTNPQGPAVSSASNSVIVTMPSPRPVETAEGTGITFENESVTLDPGRAPNPRLLRCGVVTLPASRPPTVSDGTWNFLTTFYHSGSRTYCVVPKASSCATEDIPIVGEVLCDAGSAIASGLSTLWDLATQVLGAAGSIYNGIIDGVVTVISKINPICIALKEAEDDVATTCEEVTGRMARAVISAILASVGLPPSLPSLEQLTAIAEGDITVLAVELMKQIGVPCDTLQAGPELTSAITFAGGKLGAGDEGAAIGDPCTALAAAMIGGLRKQVISSITSDVSRSTGLPSFPDVPGFSIVPDPRAVPTPMTVVYRARVAMADAQAQGVTCPVRIQPSAPSSSHAPPFPFFWGNHLWGELAEIDPIDGQGTFDMGVSLSRFAGDPVRDLADLDVMVEVTPLPPCIAPPISSELVRVRPFDP